MKRVVKTHPPFEFRTWLARNAQFDHSYRTLVGTDAHAALKEKLLTEQGNICAYTGIKISDQTSHVEHLKPQNICTEDESVNYRNMVACHPADGGDTSTGYGAPVKAGWWDEALFISPLCEECERRFTFTWNGKIKPNPENDSSAITTIEKLGLDSNELSDLRQARIKSFFGFTRRAPGLSLAQAETALRDIYQTNGDGQLQPFCFVLKQLLIKYVANKRS